MHLTMMLLPGREPDTAINIMTRDDDYNAHNQNTILLLHNNLAP